MAGINRDMLLKFLKAKYAPENMVVTVTGNIYLEEVLDVFKRLLGNWSNPQPKIKYNPYKPQTLKRLTIEKRDTEQVHLCLAVPGVSLSDPRRFPLDLLNVILGEGMSSRLFSEIRDKMGLAYSISSYVEHFLDTGALTVCASVDPKNLIKAITAILGQLEQLKDGIPESEINKAREISKGRLLLRMEDSRNVAGWLGGQEMLLNHILSLEEIVSIIDSIDVDHLHNLARELISIDKVRLAIVGPVPDSRPLRKLLNID